MQRVELWPGCCSAGCSPSPFPDTKSWLSATSRWFALKPSRSKTRGYQALLQAPTAVCMSHRALAVGLHDFYLCHMCRECALAVTLNGKKEGWEPDREGQNVLLDFHQCLAFHFIKCHLDFEKLHLGYIVQVFMSAWKLMILKPCQKAFLLTESGFHRATYYVDVWRDDQAELERRK